MPEIDGVRLPFLPIGGARELKRHSIQSKPIAAGVSFNDVFKEELNKIRFSGHAQARMFSSEIVLSQAELQKLEIAVAKADQKGSMDTLVLLNDNAFIINVPNKTVVTVIDKSRMEESVVTNIDSAVFA